MAKPFIAQMPESFQTQLGRWFKGGQELSGGSGRKFSPELLNRGRYLGARRTYSSYGRRG